MAWFMQAQIVATTHLVICAITNATGRWINPPEKVLKSPGEG
jgi:hypothetical protein